MTSRFVRFLIAGGLAAAVNIGSRMLFNLAMPFEWAVVLAYLTGMATAYGLMRIFVFDGSGRSAQSEFIRFAIVNIVGIGLVVFISITLSGYVFPAINFTWHAKFISHVLAVATPALTSYFGHKYFSFRNG